MQGDQGGGARRVDGDRGPFQAECVRHPAGQDTARVARAQVPLHAVGQGVQRADVVVVHQTGEHARPAALQRRGGDTRAFARLPRDFQEHALLRVHRQRLAGRDAEEAGVELPRLVQESALADIGGTRTGRVGVEHSLDVPAPVGGER